MAMTARVRIFRTSVKTMAGLTGFHRTRFRSCNLQLARLRVSSLVAHVSYRQSHRSSVDLTASHLQVSYSLRYSNHGMWSVHAGVAELIVMYLCRVFVGNIATACINFSMSTFTKHFL
jgi:hypothetical protein